MTRGVQTPEMTVRLFSFPFIYASFIHPTHRQRITSGPPPRIREARASRGTRPDPREPSHPAQTHLAFCLLAPRSPDQRLLLLHYPGCEKRGVPEVGGVLLYSLYRVDRSDVICAGLDGHCYRIHLRHS